MKSIYLITGFLGSGKTTFLNNLLNKSTDKVGILMNEFGKISIDTMIVRENSSDLIELTNGSIFCSCLKENFIQSLVELIKKDIDTIFIESSGLADPSDMQKVLGLVKDLVPEEPFKFIGTICLIDAPLFFKELKKMVSVEKQIKHSHFFIVNKIDLVEKENIEKVDSKLLELQPKGKIIHTSFGNAELSEFENDYFDIIDEETTNKEETKPKSLIIHLDEEPSKNELNNLLYNLSDMFFRIKGIIKTDEGWFKVDLVMDQIVFEPYDISTKSYEEYNQLVCLTSRGIKSISYASVNIPRFLTTKYRLES